MWCSLDASDGESQTINVVNSSDGDSSVGYFWYNIGTKVNFSAFKLKRFMLSVYYLMQWPRL